MRRWRAKNPGMGQAYQYGINVERLHGMWHAQDGRCAICRTPFGEKTPYVDHDHKTKRVRGLLCAHCNNGLGHVERKGWVKKAYRYLARKGLV
jgi:hypothetical protein